MVYLGPNTKGTLQRLIKLDSDQCSTIVLLVQIINKDKNINNCDIDISFLKNTCAYLLVDEYEDLYQTKIFSVDSKNATNDSIIDQLKRFSIINMIISDKILDDDNLPIDTFDIKLIPVDNTSKISISDYDKNPEKYQI